MKSETIGSASGPPARVTPIADEATEFFWASGADGHLRILRCQRCRYFVHPPVEYCPGCGGRGVAPEVVSGRARLYSFTVNHQPWDGDSEPFVIGLVELAEQADVRLLTNIVGVDIDDVSIGMELVVVFERHGAAWLPMFTRPPS